MGPGMEALINVTCRTFAELCCHETRTPYEMTTFAKDLRLAFRVLLKNPAFTAIAVSALALGIGANTAIFSVVNGVLLQPLPFRDSKRMMRVERGFEGGTGSAVSIPKF